MRPRSCVVLLGKYILNIETEQDNEFKCVCVYLLPRTQIHSHTHIKTHTTVLWSDPPIPSPSFRKPQNQTHASLFQLPFFPPSSPRQIYLNSPTVSFLFFSFFSLESNVSMCHHHKHTHTHMHTLSHTPQSGNHNKHIKALKLQFMGNDLLNRLQLIANNCTNI